MKILAIAAVIAATIYTVGCNDSNKETTTTSSDASTATTTTPAPDTSAMKGAATATADADFAMKAANGGMTEVEASKLAQSNGTAAVKDLAAMMITDHMTGGDELKAIAQKNSLMLPPSINDDSKKKLDDLGKKKGADFDKAYVAMLEADHKETIDMFQKENGSTMNADLKAWTGAKIPVFQHHLEMTMDVKGKMK